MRDMSASYVRVMEHVSQDRLAEAEKEYAGSFHRTVQELYWQAATTYPVRFRTANDWCGWTRKFVDLSRAALNALSAAAREDAPEKREPLRKKASQSLDQLRAHAYALHAQTGTTAVNDVVYLLWREAQVDSLSADRPSPKRLKGYAELFDRTPLSQAAREDEEAYRKALENWRATAVPLFEEEALTEDQTIKLREATQEFYRLYGMAFE